MKYSESETLELKKSTSEINEAIISIVAILNKHNAGELIFGISPNGTVNGQSFSEKTLRDISQKIANSIEPKIYPRVEPQKIGEKYCIIVKFVGDEPIYYAQGKAYVRVADEDKLMSAKEIEKRIQSKSNLKWDSFVSDVSFEKVNETQLKKYIEEARKTERINFSYSNKKEVLEKLELIKGNNLLNAGKILFYDATEVQTAVFAGTSKNTFLDIKDKTANIFELIEFSEKYIKEHIDWRADLSTGTRQEIPEIPIRAISESLVNSFCHRDYTAPESNKVAIYEDRIEIWNPGEFPSEFKPLDFVKKELPSVLRNPKIAKILYYNRKIEKWGSGLRRIYDECKEHDVKVKFKVLKYGFSVIFFRSKPKVTKQESDTNQTQTRHKPDEENRQKWILDYLKTNQTIKSKDIIQKFKIVKDTSVRDLNNLIKQNKIIKKGAGNNVWYELR